MKEQLPIKRKRYKKETLTHKSTKMYQKEGHNTITKRGGDRPDRRELSSKIKMERHWIKNENI